MFAAGTEVIIDDRLATVLATAPAGHAGARTQYRQLVDLLGRTPPDLPLPRPALDRLAQLEAELGASERAALIRAAPGTLRHPGLILRFAAQAPAVAAAVIQSARLDDWQWSALAIELPLAARGHLRHRRDLGPRTTGVLARLGILDLGLPAPQTGEAEVHELNPPSPPGPADGIGAIVRRIEAFRRSRKAETRQFGADGALLLEAAPRLPLDEPADFAEHRLQTIRFATDADLAVIHADAPVGPMLVGMRFGDPDGGARIGTDALACLDQRRPLREARVELIGAPAIADAWRIDATPRFAAQGGAFLGYTGVLRRPAVALPANDSPADRLRQVLHELRTPVNAIQGFAELIQQQLFGPTPHRYRSLAATIAADSAAVLAGFEEIDRLVKLETGRGEDLAGECDLAEVLARQTLQLKPTLATRSVGLSLEHAEPAPVALAETTAERMVWRLLERLADTAAPGDTLALELQPRGEDVVLIARLPAALAQCDDAALFAVEPANEAGSPALGLLGGGFALRLARAEARAAGGDLTREHGSLVLKLPGLTRSCDANSPTQSAQTRFAGGA